MAGNIVLTNQASPGSNQTGYGQLWAGNNTANYYGPSFTDEGGNTGNIPFPHEEGTWTPWLTDDTESDSEGQTYTARAGWYARNGRTCHLHGYVQMSSLGSLGASTQLRISNMPFVSWGGLYSGQMVGYFAGGNWTADYRPFMVSFGSSASISLLIPSGGSNIPLTPTLSTSSLHLAFHMVFIIG